jgi:hypothetical protein
MLILPLLIPLVRSPQEAPRFKELRRMVPESVAGSFQSDVQDINGDGLPDVLATSGSDGRALLNEGYGSLVESQAGAFPEGCNCRR